LLSRHCCFLFVWCCYFSLVQCCLTLLIFLLLLACLTLTLFDTIAFLVIPCLLDATWR
jgi:hypothetical protein